MKLSYEQIVKYTSGVSYTEQCDGTFHFHRFSKAQEEMYLSVRPGFNTKTRATAGVVIRFATDSEVLKIDLDASRASTRRYFSLDVLVNGKYLDSLSNYDETDMTGLYPQKLFPLGSFEKQFDLGKGEKQIVLVLPALANVSLRTVELADGSMVKETPKRGKYLAIGDSITQGYDCKKSYQHYTHIVAEHLNLDVQNWAIGGEVFRKELTETMEESDAQLITVAYGSNDWNGRTFEETKADCEGFLKNLVAKTNGSTIYVISPIWRSDFENEKPFGSFRNVHKMLEEVCAKYSTFKLIDGFDFVPHDTALFGDASLHPNDDGFRFYAESLLSQLK